MEGERSRIRPRRGVAKGVRGSVIAIVAVVLAAGALGIANGVDSEPKAKPVVPEGPLVETAAAVGVSALSTAPRSAKARALEKRFADAPGGALGSALSVFREVMTTESADVFVSEGKEGWACITLVNRDARGEERVPGSSCAPRSSMGEVPLMVETVGRYARIAGLVPDGYSEVSLGAATAKVAGNAFVIEDPPPIRERGPLEARGPGMPTITVE